MDKIVTDFCVFGIILSPDLQNIAIVNNNRGKPKSEGQRSKPGGFGFPGGRPKGIGESIKECLKREITEETDIEEMLILECLSTKELPSDDGGTYKRIVHFVLAKDRGTPDNTYCDRHDGWKEILGWKWVCYDPSRYPTNFPFSMYRSHADLFQELDSDIQMLVDHHKMF